MGEGQPQQTKLTVKQQRFVDAYLGAAHGNATEAAELAGYKSSSRASLAEIGSQNLRKLEIQEAIKSRVSELAMSAEEVLHYLSEMANPHIQDFVTVSDDGKPTIDLRKAAEKEKLGLVKKISYNEHGPVLELYDRQAALIQLGKYHGLWVEKQEISGKDGQPLPIQFIQAVQPDGSSNSNTTDKEEE